MGVVHGPLDNKLETFLIQLLIILVLVRILGYFGRIIKQPSVIGEIIAGIILGPSVLGYIPGFSDTIFPSSSLDNIYMFAQIGLIFFMFFLGMEVEPKLMRKMIKSSFPIAVGSIACPFAIGSALSFYLYDLDDNQSDFVSFLLFIGTAFSFTAFPVLARILTSCNLLTHPLGVQTLSAAAIDDVLAWCTLALTLSYATGGGIQQGIYTMLITAGMVAFLLLGVKRFLKYVHKQLMKADDELNRNFIAAIFLMLCLVSWFAEVIGVHAFFGAFAFGVCVPRKGNLIKELAPKIELLIIEFFLPLYFAYSGIRTNIGALNSGELWGACVLVFICAAISKIVPVTLISRYFYKDWKFCLSIGLLMNTRGLVALIALNVGLEQGILSDRLFTIMVIMSLATTFMAPPAIHFLYVKNLNRPFGAPDDIVLVAAAASKGMTAVSANNNSSLEPMAPTAMPSSTSESHSDVVSRSQLELLPSKSHRSLHLATAHEMPTSTAINVVATTADPSDGRESEESDAEPLPRLHSLSRGDIDAAHRSLRIFADVAMPADPNAPPSPMSDSV